MEDALEQDFEFVGGAGGIGAPGFGGLGLTAGVEGNNVVGGSGGIAPGHEAGAISGEGADAGAEAIRDDQRCVGSEEAGNVTLVGLELVKSFFNIGVFVCGVFEFDDGDGQAVEKEDDVGATVAVFDNGELVDGEPVVVVGLVEVDEPDEVVYAAVIALVGDGDAVGEEFVEAAIVFDQVLAFAADDLAQGFVDGVGGNVGIEASEGSAEAIDEDDVAVAVAFGAGFAGGDVAPVQAGVA